MGVTPHRPGRRLVTLEELEVVYHRDAAAFEHVAGAIVGDEKFGSDAVHDAFVQALRHRDRFRGDRPVETSLWRFVIREARKRRARNELGRHLRAGSVSDRGDARSTEQVHASRARLPLDRRPRRWESIVDTAETANRKRSRWLVRTVLLAGLAVAAGAVVLAWPYGGGAHGTILQRTAATLGDGPVLHFVIRSGWGGALINLRTGGRNHLYATQELWYESGHGIHEVSRFAGVAQGDATYSAAHLFSLDKTLGSLVTRYRQALRNGTALVLRRDIVEGQPVYWIRVHRETLSDAHGRLHTWTHEVAVSQETFAPVAVRERRDSKTTSEGNSIVLKAESLPEGDGNFTRMPHDSTGRRWRIGTTGLMTPFEASAVLGRPALWAGPSIAGLGLARIWQDARSEGYNSKSGSWAKTFTGVTFYYGTLDQNGDPAIPRSASGAGRQMRFVQVSESRTLDSLFQRVASNYSPPEGSILIFDFGTAVMQKDGLYLALGASSDDLLLAAARTLERVKSIDRADGDRNVVVRPQGVESHSGMAHSRGSLLGVARVN
jgi:DNA-directed RNA polymerase specialized sigma24 family protein